MKVHYIYHSCFAVETVDTLLIFDYSQDSADGRLERLMESCWYKQRYFIVSHFHEDHFSPDIMKYMGARKLISYDTSKRRRIKPYQVTAVLRPGDTYEDEHLKMMAIRSTDVGISSLVWLPDGTTLYHAGDNNNWYFAETPEEHIRCSVDEMEGLFRSTLREIKMLTPCVDHVMFPIDPRLGSEMMRGACQWLQLIHTRHFYPMHCWDRWDEVGEGVEQLKELFPQTTFHLGNQSDTL